jgi:hypothetical protein
VDTFFYTRTAIAGWAFVIVIIASIAASNGPEWQTILKVFNDRTISPLVQAMFGALVGISGPPVIGFLLERVVEVILWIFGGVYWKFGKVKSFTSVIVKETEPEVELTSEGTGALFHICFYQYADPKFLDWARRRRMHMYASLTTALSIFMAICVVLAWFRSSFSLCITIISLIVAVILIVHGILQYCVHKKTTECWIDHFGKRIVLETKPSKGG